MAKKIVGNHDGKHGGNNTYSIHGRSSNIPRKTIVREVKQGKHPDFHVYKTNGQEFVRGDLDGNKKNNINN